MRILVTGGAGFLGSYLCDQLWKLGNHVYCMDDFSSGTMSNIAALIDRPSFQLVSHDVRCPYPLNVDQIYNLACPASPVHYQADPIKTFQTCVLGAINVLELAKQCGATVLQASTSEVYGDPDVHPQPESYHGRVNITGYRSCYDEGKRGAETLFMNYHREEGVSIRIARIFNTYGPQMRYDDGRVISNFVCQALVDGPITIYGDGSQTRSFCYRDDLIDGLLRLMNCSDDFVGPVNLGNPNEYTMLDLAKLIIRLTDSKSELTFLPLPSDDPTRRQPDITLAKKKLGWEPTVNLREGLLPVIEWFRQLIPENKRKNT